MWNLFFIKFIFENTGSQEFVDPNMVKISTANWQRVGKFSRPLPSTTSYFSGVQIQHISFTATFSSNSISSSVPSKKILSWAIIFFSEHEYFSEQKSKSIITFWIIRIGIVSYQYKKKVHIQSKYLVFLLHQCFGMLNVLENEISMRKWSGDTAQLRTLEGTLISSSWILAVSIHSHVSSASVKNVVMSVTKKWVSKKLQQLFS